jgi:RNA polymerase sigma-70 factor, ECF subfamily
VPFETPGAVERSERLGAVAAMLYLLFNEGYSSSGAPNELHVRTSLCDEAIRLTRMVLRLFPSEPEVMGLLALMLLQHSRSPSRLDDSGNIVLLDDQDRTRWNALMIAEGLAMVDKAMHKRQPGIYQVQAAIAAIHAHAKTAAETDWLEIDQLYSALERLQPSPVVTLNRAVAVSKCKGAAAALELIAPLAEPLAAYFHFYGVKGALHLELGQTNEARAAFDKAISLSRTAAEAAHIRQHLDRLKA